jgi:hypothetical protein
MSLVIVNPSPKRKATRKAKRKTTTPAPKKAKRKGVTMAKRHRSPAQRRAFAKMISHNPHRKRRRRYASNPAPRRAVRRRRYNPAPLRHYRRRRNPSGGGGDMFKELMSADGAIMIAAIAGWPTVGGLVMNQFLPSMTGYTKYATQAGIGVGLGWLIHRFAHKQAGKMVALTALGNGVAQLIQVYQGTLQGYQTLGARVTPGGFRTMAGYVPMGRNNGNLNGVPREPGLVNTALRIS